jgi:RNA polymerase sigma-70 factor (ECF subfamily)
MSVGDATQLTWGPGREAAAVAAEEALLRFMEHYERPLYTYLLTLLRDGDTAMDCVQDTFIRAYEHLRKGREVTRNWLYTVARNRAMDEYRRRRFVRPELERLERTPALDSPTERRMDVRRALESLSPVDREVLYLYEVAGFKTAEIGDMLGVRGAAVRQRLSRARERFRQVYEP